MHIVVTGGSGKLGGAVVERLLDSGHQVTNVDARPAPGSGARFLRVDLTDYGQVVEALTGIDDAYDAVDAVVHLAAVPAPGLIPNAATFANNVPSTFHVFQAAKLAGIRKVVWASSETVLGLPFDLPPGVRAGRRGRRQTQLDLLARQARRGDDGRAVLPLGPGPVDGRAAVLQRDARRDYADFAGYTADKRRFNLWSYIDARDAAQAVSWRWLQAARVEVFVIASPDVVPHVAGSRRCLPTVRLGAGHPRARRARAPLDIDKAGGLLGYNPRTAGGTASERSLSDPAGGHARMRSTGSHGLRTTRQHRPRRLGARPRYA